MMYKNSMVLHRSFFLFSVLIFCLILTAFLYFLTPQFVCFSVKAYERGIEENIDITSISDQIDQIQPDRKDMCYSSKNNETLIQSFKPVLNILTKIKLLGWRNGAAPGDLIISVCDSLDGVPLSSLNISSSDIPLGENNADWFEADIPDIYLCPNSTYYIKWKTDFEYTGISYYWWFDYYRSPNRPDDDAYTYGVQYRLGTKYPLNDFCFKTYGYSIPTINFTSPSNNDDVYGNSIISGTAHIRNDTIKQVEISIDNNNWTIVNGTNEWIYEWNTFEVKNGIHKVSVRSYDGKSYSLISNISVTVNNTKLGIKWISGGNRKISFDIKNAGLVNAYNVSCSLMLKNIISKNIHFHSIDIMPLMAPGENEILSQKIEKKSGIILLKLSVKANNANLISLKTYGFIFGPYVIIL